MLFTILIAGFIFLFLLGAAGWILITILLVRNHNEKKYRVETYPPQAKKSVVQHPVSDYSSSDDDSSDRNDSSYSYNDNSYWNYMSTAEMVRKWDEEEREREEDDDD